MNQTYLTEFEIPIWDDEHENIVEVIKTQVPAYRDESGEEMLTDEALDKIEQIKARHLGLLTPLEIRQLRQKLSVTQTAMAGLLQAGTKSYTRWESGKSRPSRLVNVLLSALRDGRIDISYLTRLREQRFDWSCKVIPFDARFTHRIGTGGATIAAESQLQDSETHEPVALTA